VSALRHIWPRKILPPKGFPVTSRHLFDISYSTVRTYIIRCGVTMMRSEAKNTYSFPGKRRAVENWL